MSEVTREAADRWWVENENHMKVYVAHAFNGTAPPPLNPWTWWRSLPDERAVAIYSQESGR